MTNRGTRNSTFHEVLTSTNNKVIGCNGLPTDDALFYCARAAVSAVGLLLPADADYSIPATHSYTLPLHGEDGR